MQPSMVQKSLIGQTLGGKYVIDGEIGRGGFGVVYRATHLGLGKLRAIKILSHLDEDRTRRFEIEARALAELNHPYIVAVVDVGATEEGNPYLVMEYVEGRSLGDILKGSGKLLLPRMLDIMKCVCSAVHYAHERGIIHRDLKPSNIIVQPLSGEGEIAKVLDFGLAKFVGNTREIGSLGPVTQSGVILGTMEYLSPEQCEGKTLDERSDIYALGVILYQMLAGTPPFTGDTPLSIVTKHLHTPPPPLHQQCPETPLAVEAVISRALRKDPAERQKTALELRRELERAVIQPELLPLSDTEEVAATVAFDSKNSLRQRHWRWLPPRVLAVVVGLAVLLASFLIYRYFFSRAEPRPWLVTDPAGWRESFPLTQDGHPRPREEFWNAPPEWLIVRGSEGPGDGALLVQGPGVGILRPPEQTSLYDFFLRFGATMVRGNKISWVLRHQGPKDYYLFELTFPKDERESAQLQGYVFSQSEDRPRPFSPDPKLISEFGPCQPGDLYWVEVVAKGNTFIHKLRRDRGDSSIGDFTVQVEPGFQARTYRYGTLGFGGLTGNGAFIIEYVLVQQLAPEKP